MSGLRIRRISGGGVDRDENQTDPSAPVVLFNFPVFFVIVLFIALISV